MSKEVVLFGVLGFVAIWTKDIEGHEYAVAVFWGIAALLWLRNYWLEYRRKKRQEENERRKKKEHDEWAEKYRKKNGREPSLGDWLDYYGAPKLKDFK